MSSRTLRGRLSGLPLLLIFGVASGCLLPAQEPPSAYAKSETCQVCHEDTYNAFRRNAHAIVETDQARGWAGRACESCHGPGAKHAESLEAADIINPSKLDPMLADKDCLKCHLNQPTHIGRIRGSHARNQVSCVSCHPIHGTEQVQLQPHHATRINEQCSKCHTEIWASFQRPHGHKLPQGAMSCVDCHNPHGSFLPKNIRTAAANEPGCLNCHGDKRGPFVFEHAPVRLEGCWSCHEPHGSANPKMLARQEARNLCLECHATIYTPEGTSPTGALGGVPPSFHDLRSARFRNCTICHIKIHGSQANRDFLR